MGEIELERLSEYIWEIPKTGEMTVPARVFASEELLNKIKLDKTLEQARNMTLLPGIYKYTCALPDAHQGYGFPVGGVAASDVEHGMLSPGAVGFDINCITGDSKILHQDGYYREIGEIEDTWSQTRLLCQDFSQETPIGTTIVRYLKLHPRKPVYRVVTEAGHQLKATGDHPFWTPKGMIELEQLRAGDYVAIYPFEGVPYEALPDDILVDEAHLTPLLERFGKGSNGNARVQILNQLRRRGLLPLRLSSPKLSHLLRLLGFIFGDGAISFGRKRKGQIAFYGNPEDLEPIREDIIALGFSPNQIYTRERHHQIKTFYGKCEFDYRETSVHVQSSAFALLLMALGAPVSFKSQQDYRLPAWLFEVPLWQKRLFLAALFGAELSKPQTLTDHGYNFYTPILSLNKREGFVESGQAFLEDIATLLREFGVKTKTISVRKSYINRDGSLSYRLRLSLSSQSESLLNLWGQVGFEYNRERQVLANAAVQYLKLKQWVLETRERATEKALVLQAAGLSPSHIYRELERATGVRIASNFPTFEEYVEEATTGLGKSGMVWDRIAEIEPLENFDDDVYDFTVDHPDHNFIANGFVVSNCGVRVVKSQLTRDDLRGKEEKLLNTLFTQIPTGLGKGSVVSLPAAQVDEVARNGVRWALKHGYAVEDDLNHCEDNGMRPGADPSAVSSEAKARARHQLGSLGSGNHFLEVQRVAEIHDTKTTRDYGLFQDQLVVMIHCGSRGFGHQICTDYLRRCDREYPDLIAQLPDRQLAYAPAGSRLADDYYKAMNCAINFAWCNRQLITHRLRECFESVLEEHWENLGLDLLYDVAHNIGKIETHKVNGAERAVYVHRKGATRAFPKGRPEVPAAYRDVGQPVLIPGSMGTGSYILKGTPGAMELTFGSTAHGAGRVMSRTQAKKRYRAKQVQDELRSRGIFVRGQSQATIAEEAPGVYKDLDEVVHVSHELGIGTKVARMVPVLNIKG
ncbi:MAG: RtcB family protein [Candidatus Bipolaricaulia bacterium]